MRVFPASATVSMVLVALVVTACSSGSKTADAPATTAGSATVSPVGSQASGTSAGPSSSAAFSRSAGSGSAAGFNACSLLTAARASTIVGRKYTGATPQTPATGVDECTYAAANDDSDLTLFVYQPASGISFDSLKSVQTGVGQVTTLSGVGDKAIIGPLELDAQVGDQLIAVEGAGGTLAGHQTKAIAVAKIAITALH